MNYRTPLLGWAACLGPVALAAACAASDAPGSDWTGMPASAGTTSAAAGQGASGSSSGAPAGPARVTTGVSSSSSGGVTTASGNSGGNGGSSGASSGGTQATSSGSGSGTGSSSGSPTSLGDGGASTQSKTVPDIFADAGPYAPPVEAGQGEHNAGKSCIQSGCHAAGQGPQAPDPFTIAGTVFKDYAGTIPYVGAEVRVQDANGQTMTTYTHDNGNFSFGRSVAFPAMVAVRDATTTRPMVTQLTTAAMGSCAMAGCHIVGGSPSSGAYYPIHLP